MRPRLLVLGVFLSGARLLAQAPPAPPAPYAPNASASPSVAPAGYVPNASASPGAAASAQAKAGEKPAVDTSDAMDRLGQLVKDGQLNIEADLQEGQVPAIPKYALVVKGSPKATIDAQATDGEVKHMRFAVENGQLIVRGGGLRPKLAIEGVEFQQPAGVTSLKVRGLGIWRPIIAIFRGIARSAVNKLEFHTDIPSVLKGNVIGGKKAAAPKGATPPPAATPTPAPSAVAGGPPPSPTPSFMDLVKEVRLHDVKFTAYPGKPMRLRPFVEFDTASQPSGEAMALSIEKGVFRPGRDGAPNFIEVSGHLEGEIENGSMEFEKNTTTIAKGKIEAAAFDLTTLDGGKIASSLKARALFFELSSGHFVVPGGMAVGLNAGSTFQVNDLSVTSAGQFSGVAILDLSGQTGELSRKGATISASDIKLKTPGLKIVDGKATGPLEVSFNYQLEYPFVVKYPIENIPEKKLDLDFHGPFATKLQLTDAGGDEGEVTGTYVFKAPWDPIEQAALVVLAAKWRQDLAIKNVDFTIVPKMFRPCGETCFTLGIEFTAEKKAQKGLKKLFYQYCAPVGKANLFVDKPNRAFILKDLKIETHCKGVIGWVVNFLTPFLTKTYGDMKLFQMPPDLPLTVDSVRGGAQLVEIAGTVDWQAGEPKPKVPPEPQPAVVPPGR
jgi:hypothetical protein